MGAGAGSARVRSGGGAPTGSSTALRFCGDVVGDGSSDDAGDGTDDDAGDDSANTYDGDWNVYSSGSCELGSRGDDIGSSDSSSTPSHAISRCCVAAEGGGGRGYFFLAPRGVRWRKVARGEMEGEPHKLHRTWTLTFKSPHKSRRMPDSRGWLNTVKPVAVITTVEELWGVVDAVRPPSRLAQNGDYCLFDAKCAPTWEDVHNAQGGKWSASFTRDEAAAFDAAWEQGIQGFTRVDS